jgi:hypothetical protein
MRCGRPFICSDVEKSASLFMHIYIENLEYNIISIIIISNSKYLV